MKTSINLEQLQTLQQISLKSGTTAACLSIAVEYAEHITKAYERTHKDALTMALRLMGEDPKTFASETKEVMTRWKPICEKLLEGEQYEPS